MRKILPTVKKSKITLYTHHALPLQIPFITKETESWFMSCFINVFYRYEFPTFYDYTDYNVFYRDIMYRDSLTYSTALTLNTRENFFLSLVMKSIFTHGLISIIFQPLHIIKLSIIYIQY